MEIAILLKGTISKITYLLLLNIAIAVCNHNVNTSFAPIKYDLGKGIKFTSLILKCENKIKSFFTHMKFVLI